ncbi:MAG: hypothetical protein U5L07_14780 [Desulfobacterales bacterium]|nr:hypothetical protein [Desulfobacterales bacterium]
MPKLILHAGLHKTGTTAIQAFAAKNRKALFKQGFLYPDYSPALSKPYEAHHDFAHTIAGKGKRLSEGQARQLARHWAKIADNENLTLFLSSESISRHVDDKRPGTWHGKRKAYLKNLAGVLSAFDIKVLLVLRRQDDYVKSLFQEHVMKNAPAGRQPFSAFLKNFEKSEIQKRFYQNLLLFEEVFPGIKVLIYEDLIKDGQLCTNFFSSLCVDTCNMAQVGIVRKSLSAPETVLKIFLNRVIDSKKQNREVIDCIHSPEVQGLLDSYYPNKKYDLWENHRAREKFLALFAEENEKICKRYFPQRQDPLFPSLKNNTNPRIPEIPEALKAELALKGLYLKKSFYESGRLEGKNIDKIIHFFKKLARKTFTANK